MAPVDVEAAADSDTCTIGAGSTRSLASTRNETEETPEVAGQAPNQPAEPDVLAELEALGVPPDQARFLADWAKSIKIAGSDLLEALASMHDSLRSSGLVEDILLKLKNTLIQSALEKLTLKLEPKQLERLAAAFVEMLDEDEFQKVLQTPAHALSLAYDVYGEAPELVRALATRCTHDLLGKVIEKYYLDKIDKLVEKLPDSALRELALHPERMAEKVSVRAREWLRSRSDAVGYLAPELCLGYLEPELCLDPCRRCCA